jgi:hypothetical protein
MRTSSLRFERPAIPRLLLGLLVAALVGLFLPLSGCSDGGGASRTAVVPSPGTVADSHAIHVFAVEGDGTKKQLDFRQGTEIAAFSGSSRSSSMSSHVGNPSVLPAALSAKLQTGSSKSLSVPVGPGRLSLLDNGTSPVLPPPTIGNPDPGTTPLLYDPGFSSTAWALVERASIQCFAEQATTSNLAGLAGQSSFSGSPTLVSLPPWIVGATNNDWFVYGGLGQSCDVEMIQEQNLLCIADKLAAIGDAVGTIVWPAVDPSLQQLELDCAGSGTTSFSYGSDAAPPACSPDLYVTWSIPPQADNDRFIVRDLAIHTLGLIPTIDNLEAAPASACPNTTAPVCTCAELYADVMNGSLTRSQGLGSVFGSPALNTAPAFPPSTVPLFVADSSGTITQDNSKSLATTASEIEAQVLRAGGRLLHDLIRRNVYSDMAAAAQQSAHALDPVRGNLITWGMSDLGAYGTLAHAARVLAGRWEIGDTPQALYGHGDPQCNGVLAINDLTQAFGDDLTARVQDVPIQTPGQARAADLVETAGIVLPSCAIQAMGASGLRGALAAQLLLQEQLRDQIPTNASSPMAAVYTNIVNQLSDPEVLFGFNEALGIYRILTNSADALTANGCTHTVDVGLPGVGIAGLLPVAASAVVSGISTNHGVVFAGGVTTSRLSTDPIARAGGILRASECDENNADWDYTGFPTSSGGSLVDHSLPPGTFQDAFSMGQAFERRLAFLRDHVASSSTGSPDDPEPVARGAIAELKSWAGSALVVSNPVGTTTIEIATTGLDYSTLGIGPGLQGSATAAEDQAIASAIGFVWGPPWAAECAAHVSGSCPQNFDATWVAHPAPFLTANLPHIDITPTLGDTAGIDGLPTPVFDFLISTADPTVPNFAPVPPPALPAQPNSRLYMVLTHDPTSTTGRGKVLGVVQLPWTAGSSPILDHSQLDSFVIAPMQEELLNDTIDIGKWVGAAPPRLGDSTAADPPGYCVDGVPRDIFVPLQNELTSTTGTSFEDSWQHYLDIAQQAATAADTLGQQLLNENLQISERDEAAGEQLADLCGDVGALSQTTTDANGNVTPSPSDTALTSCFDEPTVDFVTLADIPPSEMTPDPQTWVGNILHCTQPNDRQRDPLCDTQKQRPLTIGSLKIKPFQDLGPAPLPAAPATLADCLKMSSLAASRGTGFQATAFRSAVGSSLYGTSSLQLAATSLRMNVDLSDNWTVTYQNKIIMDSHPPAAGQVTTLWPGCLRANTCANNLAQLTNGPLNTAFRYCPAIPADSPNLLTALLGSKDCDPNAPSTNADMAELNMIKWRIEGALWTIAASAGEVPSGMFNMPIPVVTQPSQGPQIQTFTGAAYNGRLSPPTNGTYTLPALQGMVTNGESLNFGVAYDMPPAWAAFPTYAKNEIPNWYLSLYDPAAQVIPKMVQASNTPLTWSCQSVDPVQAYDTNVANQELALFGGAPPSAPYMFDTCNSSTKLTNISLADALDNGAWSLDGIKCAAPFGELQAGAPAGPSAHLGLPEVVNALKTNFDSSPFITEGCQSSGGLDFWPAWSEWSSDAHYAPLWHPCVLSGGILNTPYEKIPASGLAQGGYPSDGSYRIADPSPARRVNAFANMSGVNGTCQAVASLVDAAALNCFAQAQPTTVASASSFLPSPPSVATLEDTPNLQRWLSQMASVLNVGLQQLYVENVPQRVIADFQNGTVGSGSKAGVHGQDVLNMEEALNSVPGSWSGISSDLTRISEAIQGMSVVVTGANLAQSSAMSQAALQAIQVQGQMTQASDSVWSAFTQTFGSAVVCIATDGAGCGALVGSLASLAGATQASNDAQQTGNQELVTLNTQKAIASSAAENQVAQAIVFLNETTTPLWTDLQTGIDNIRGSVLKIQAAGADLQLTQSKAAYQAAVGTGAESVMIGGSEVPIPVNTVLNRQSSATEIRYQSALSNAKALAYMARRAIEQRIGIPLNEMTQPVGALDAPAGWADDICSLTGINYQALSTATPADAGGQGSAADNAVVSQFADSFVGDYVAKLSNFVQYFNVQYPSHQGDDTAVLSLRGDLLDPIPQCTQVAPNLLVNSGSLDDILSSAQAATVQQGWQLGPCVSGASTCLSTISGAALGAPLDGPGAGLDTFDPNATNSGISDGSTGISWLVDLPQTPAGGGNDAGAADAGGPDAGADAGADAGVVSLPPGLVTQAVSLQAGSYVLSWWDQARNPDGSLLLGSPTTKYVVRVFDPGFIQVAQFNDFPYAAGTDASISLWSARQTLPFIVSSAGTYYVSFGASTPDEAPGSVAIADVQLETAQSNGGPSVYVQTSNTRLVAAYGCPPSDADLRSAFVHTCDNSGSCYYDLTTPIIIDTESLNNGTSPLAGKLAKGNFNFRHVNLAVNLVGTGVHDCTNTPTAACFGTGYIEYTLEHDGTNAGILDWNGNVRFFDFGIADVQHGKALAAERYLTMPLGSDDQMLISQPGIQHIEFAGRPLDGTYHLRIYDSPALQWNNLQDVQIILNYEYWSEIVANGITQGN